MISNFKSNFVYGLFCDLFVYFFSCRSFSKFENTLMKMFICTILSCQKYLILLNLKLYTTSTAKHNKTKIYPNLLKLREKTSKIIVKFTKDQKLHKKRIDNTFTRSLL